MRVRGFFGRHRIASGMLAPGILGAAALITLPWALSSAGPTTVDTELTASVTECHDMVTVSIAGRGDTPAPGTPRLLDAMGQPLPAALSSDYSSTWVDSVVNAPSGTVGSTSYAAAYIAYPANMDTYENAVATGVANTESVMRNIQQSCPNTRFAVVGYSEGADVARRVAMDVGHQIADAKGSYGIVNPANVTGVVIFADAGRAGGAGPFPGATNPFTNPNGFNQTYQTGNTPTNGQGAVQGTGGSNFGALNGRIAAFCSDGDLTCSAPQNISLLNLAVNVGRQLNIDSLQKDGLTPANGQGVAIALGQIAFNAFQDIQSTPNWMQSNETFLDVLLKVSDPTYKPGRTTAVKDTSQVTSISTKEMSPLAYLPQKMFKEIVALIATNQNTIPVVMSDPYNLTLGPGSGHHFDYWRDANAADGKPLTSSQYAAAWLTQLAQQAQAGTPLDTTVQPDPASVAAALAALTPTPTTPSTDAPVATTPATTTSATNMPTAADQSASESAASPEGSSASATPAPTASATMDEVAATPSAASGVAPQTGGSAQVTSTVTPTTPSAASNSAG